MFDLSNIEILFEVKFKYIFKPQSNLFYLRLYFPTKKSILKLILMAAYNDDMSTLSISQNYYNSQIADIKNRA